MCIELFIPIIKSLFAFMCFGSTSDSWINVWSDVKIEAQRKVEANFETTMVLVKMKIMIIQQ